MNCHYCGTSVDDRREYCLHCGRPRQEAFPAGPAAPEEIHTPAPEAWLPEPVDHLSEAPVGDVAVCVADSVFPDLSAAPALELPTRRSLAKMFFLGILTLGIYPTVIFSRMVTELNIAASRHDGLRTMPYFAMVTLAPLTLGIYPLVWMHRFCRRIGRELTRRGIDASFGPRDFWLWGVLGMLILVGPFVFQHRLTRAMNRVNEDFNRCA